MYKILMDYGSEGYKLDDKEFITINEAIKYATKYSYGNEFLIVKIIDWQVIEL